MKKILTLLLYFLIPFACLSQDDIGELFDDDYVKTTWEEYNYCAKGYSNQLKNGLDPQKKGYELKVLNSTIYSSKLPFSNRKNTYVDFIGMIDEKSRILKAFIVVENAKSEYPKCYCFPTPYSDDDIQKKFDKFLLGLDRDDRIDLLNVKSIFIHDYYNKTANK